MNSFMHREPGEGVMAGASTLAVDPAATDVRSEKPAAPLGAKDWEKWRWPLFVALTVLLGLLICYPVRHFEFLNFDDDMFVSGNPWLAHGFTWASVRWAFEANLTEYSSRAEYWEPLTLLSRLLDAQLYGISSGPFHVTSALLHVLNALLLGVALFRLTGRWKRSILVALIFLVHPLNVEPVGWLSARKDLVGGTFFICTLLAYANYARRPCARTYAWLLAAFCGGLMAKPMVITIPFVLVALDWWPLGRIQAARGKREEQIKLVAEKIPLVILAIIGAILAVMSQQDFGAIGAVTKYPMWTRVVNALIAYVTYVRRVFWPSDLAAFYLHRGTALSVWEGVGALAILIALSFVALWLARRRPYVIAGWVWFGIVLGPVIGLVQIGNQAMADRYAYPSAIGIFVIAVWGMADWLERRPRVSATLAVGAVAALTLCAMRQTLTWQNTITVFTHAAAVTENNSMAYLSLGGAYHQKGQFDQARECYRKCIELNPESAAMWMNAGNVERDAGRTEAAMEDYNFSLQLNPYYEPSLLAVARTLIADKQLDAGVPFLMRAIGANRDGRESYVLLALLFQEQNRWKHAERVWTAYLRVHPDDRSAQSQMALARSKLAEANGETAPN